MAEQERRWLEVPYRQRREAKAKGAQWDPLVRMWWVPLHVPRKSVEKWLPQGANE